MPDRKATRLNSQCDLLMRSQPAVSSHLHQQYPSGIPEPTSTTTENLASGHAYAPPFHPTQSTPRPLSTSAAKLSSRSSCATLSRACGRLLVQMAGLAHALMLPRRKAMLTDESEGRHYLHTCESRSPLCTHGTCGTSTYDNHLLETPIVALSVPGHP